MKLSFYSIMIFKTTHAGALAQKWARRDWPANRRPIVTDAEAGAPNRKRPSAVLTDEHRLLQQLPRYKELKSPDYSAPTWKSSNIPET
jgi:hypothetical protein